MKDIIIYGSGSIGRLVEQIIHDINREKRTWNILGYIDDNKKLHKEEISGYQVLGDLDVLRKFDSISVVLAIGNPKSRFQAYKSLKEKNNVDFPSLIHPKAIISRRVEIGEGTVIYPGVIVDVDVEIGKFNILNKLVTIGHDSKISSFCIISPGVNIGGKVVLGDGVEMGINSSTIQNLHIGKWSIIGAGSAVIRDIIPNTVNVGVPSKMLKKMPKNW